VGSIGSTCTALPIDPATAAGQNEPGAGGAAAPKAEAEAEAGGPTLTGPSTCAAAAMSSASPMLEWRNSNFKQSLKAVHHILV